MLRLLRAWACPLALVLALGAETPVGADVVTVSGTGTFGEWMTFVDGAYRPVPADQLPEWLLSAFPPGLPFTAAFTYDPAAVREAREAPELNSYIGPITSWRVQAGPHTLSPTGAFEGGIVGVVNDSDFPVDPFQDDTLYAAVERTRLFLDGQDALAGNLLNGSQIYLYDPTRSALADRTLPASVCMGAFPELRVGFAVDPGFRIFATGTPDRSVDSDADGLNDGQEIAAGTDPCRLDTDGDGLPDGADPDPLVPETPSQGLARQTREAAAEVLATPVGVFAGPNSNAEAGRRNALSNQLQAAANAIEAGDLATALAILEHVRSLLDGAASPPDIMEDGPEKDALRAEVEALIAGVLAQL